MKLILFFMTIVFVCGAKAECDSTQVQKDLGKAGAVSFRLGDKACVGNKEQCFEQWQKDRDFCESKKTVVKYSCDKNQVKSEKLDCPQGTQCVTGACVVKH